MRVATAVLSLVLLAAGCSADDDPADTTPPTQATQVTPPGVLVTPTATGPQVVATELEAPWGLAFLPDGSALVSERDTRRIKQVTADGEVRVVDRVEEADAGGEGGLLGIAVSPSYATDALVYAYYTTGSDNRIARFRLGERPDPIVTGIPVSGIHNGGRIVFGPDGMLYAGTGDASTRGQSQDRDSLGGKVLRMRPDGSAPPDNPFPDSVVYSLGHRNVQGLAFDAAGRLWASEFGQNTWDEVNRIEAGRNYGWPEVEGRGDNADFVDPLVQWEPDDASPSGVAIVDDVLYVAALRGQRLWRVPLDGSGGVGTPDALLVNEFGRLRHVAAAPDGSLWVLTSNRDGRGSPEATDDRIIRLVP